MQPPMMTQEQFQQMMQMMQQFPMMSMGQGGFMLPMMMPQSFPGQTPASQLGSMPMGQFGSMPMMPMMPMGQFGSMSPNPMAPGSSFPPQMNSSVLPPPPAALGPSQIIQARPETLRLARGPGSAEQWIDNCYGRIDSGLEFVLKEWFQTVDQDRSGHIDRNELKMALNAAGETFSESTIRMMVDMFDTDKNGTIDFNEFRHLFKYIQILREAFEAQDHDRNNRLDLQEVRQALTHAQYPFKDPKTTVKLLQRFDPKERNALVFENFVELAVQLGQTRTLFNKLDTDKDNLIKLNLDEVVSLTLDYS